MNNKFKSSYYNEIELRSFGFKSVGANVKIAKNNIIEGVENISIGNNVRIDGYCTLIANGNGWIEIGSFIHIGGWSFLSARNGVVMKDFSGISQGVKIYSNNDDYSGNFMTNPTVPSSFTAATGGQVTLEEHVVIGSGTVILPNLTIHKGSCVGAMSLVTKSLDPWGVYFGLPVKYLKKRSQKLLDLEKKLKDQHLT